MNTIHPTAILEGDIQLGTGNRILPYSILYGPLTIGNDNVIGPHVIIGAPGQDTRNRYYESAEKQISIGNRNIIREFTAIHKPCYEELTAIHDDVYIMQSVHIPHDAIIESDVVITPMVAFGGLTRILTGANIALGVQVHQRTVIGQYSIAGMGASIVKNVKPFSRIVPGQPISVNAYAIKKFSFEEYSDEIYKYVHESITPKSERILAIVEHYRRKHIESGRDEY